MLYYIHIPIALPSYAVIEAKRIHLKKNIQSTRNKKYMKCNFYMLYSLIKALKFIQKKKTKLWLFQRDL